MIPTNGTEDAFDASLTGHRETVHLARASTAGTERRHRHSSHVHACNRVLDNLGADRHELRAHASDGLRLGLCQGRHPCGVRVVHEMERAAELFHGSHALSASAHLTKWFGCEE